MLLRGSILLAALLTVASGGGFAANAVPIKEITEDVIDGGDEQQVNSRELQSRYGVQPNYPTANRYNEAKKNTPDPTPKPSSYSAPSSGTGRRGNLTVYTEDDGRKYVYRFRNGVKNKVYMDTPGWNAGGRRQRTGVRPSGNNNGSRVRTGNSNRRWRRPGGTMPRRKRPDDWSAPTPSKKPTPTPTKWTSGGSGWRPKPEIPSYSGGYDNSYHDPTLGPTMVPTWDNDGFGNCVEPFKSTCCDQKEYYTFDQKQSLCKKLNCDISDCDKNGDTWRSGNEPTAVPTWDTDGWDGDDWKDNKTADECTVAKRTACCSQTVGDDDTKIKMCERLKCDWNKCQKEYDTEPTEPTAGPSDSPSVSAVPTWNADGWTGDEVDGKCSKEEQDRCCSQHESKSLEVQAKSCQNKWGCSVFKCPQYRKGDDGWDGDSFEGLDWSDDGHLDDTCTADEQDKCCEQHDGIPIAEQQQICKVMWNCSLLKCPKHRQSNYDYDTCSKDNMVACCRQDPNKPYDLQYSYCSELKCDIHKCDVDWYKEDEDRCTDEEHYKCCTQPDSIAEGTKHDNCVETGCSFFKCIEDDADYNKKNKWDDMGKPKFQFGYGGDESTCPDSNKWKCCSPDQSILGSTKAIVKNCEDLGCSWDMCPQNMDHEFYDSQSYDDSSYEYGGGYDSNDQCTDAGKWSCCYPDSSLSGLKAWVKNCQRNDCEWQKCPHHKQGYLDPTDPTLKKEEPALQCSNKEQVKCCTYQGSLKEAAKYCQELTCDIADCNNHDGGGYFMDNYYNNNYNSNNYNDGGYNYNDGGYNIDLRDGDVSYGDGQPNKGPRPDADNGYVDYGGYGSSMPQWGNKGPRLNDGSSGNNNNNDKPQGNKGSKNGDGGSDFLDQGVDEDCKEEWTSGQACRLVCTRKVEYKLMGVVMSTHDETTTKPCN